MLTPADILAGKAPVCFKWEYRSLQSAAAKKHRCHSPAMKCPFSVAPEHTLVSPGPFTQSNSDHREVPPGLSHALKHLVSFSNIQGKEVQ